MPGYHIQIVLNPPRTLHQPHPDSFIPASLFQPLPNHPPKSTLRRDTLSRPNLNKDYRTGPIRVDWIDFEQMSLILHGGKKVKEHGRGVKLHLHLFREPLLKHDIIIQDRLKLLSYRMHITSPGVPTYLKAPCMSSEMDQLNLPPKNWKLKFQKCRFPTLIPTELC